MAVTPLIKPITNRSGVFYAFQSAINDTNLIASQQNMKFTFSKFALLRVPEIGVLSESDVFDVVNGDMVVKPSVVNKMQLGAVGDSLIIDPTLLRAGGATEQSMNLAESFQNYCLNMEAVLMSQPAYKSGNRSTTSERVFFKWLKESGALRFRAGNTYENAATGGRFVEEDEVFDVDSGAFIGYNKVVKYINDISAVHTNKGDNVYTELYIYVPTDHGTTPHVLFKSVSDDNYKVGTNYVNVANATSSIEYLSGRDEDDVHPFGLTAKSYYDYDGDENVVYEKFTNGAWESGAWFIDGINNAVPNSYMTEPAFGTAVTDVSRKTSGNTSVMCPRNTLDGIMIDWDLDSYKLAKGNDSIENLNDFNSYIGSKDFEYNVVLIYYDMVDSSDPSNVKTVTNLYGVQFVSNMVGVGTEHIVHVKAKYKPDLVGKINGNALAEKINLKSDSSHDNAGVVKLLNTKTGGDYNTFSMDLFIQALTSMNDMSSAYRDNITYITDMRNEITTLKQLFLNDENKEELALRIGVLENSVSAASSLFENSQSVMMFITDLYKKYNNIMENTTTVDVTYNMSRSAINNLVDHPQEYNPDVLSYKTNLFSTDIVNTVKLNKNCNYLKHSHTGDVTISSDYTIRVDDTLVPWSSGQVMDIVFDTKVVFAGGSGSVGGVLLMTDATNKMGAGTYSKLIKRFTYDDFVGIGYDTTVTPPVLANVYVTPMFRVTCVDSDSMKFEVDRLR
jgi:hypothetical protein